MMSSDFSCLLCGGGSIEYFPAIELKGVSSDCLPWHSAGEFCVCGCCGHIQKKMTDRWLKDVEDIYAAYNPYPLTETGDQLVFDNGVPTSRHRKLIQKFSAECQLPREGEILDVGCGNGQFLRNFGSEYPGWDMFGCDQLEERRSEMMAIPGMRGFYTGDVEDIDGKFDLITLVYVIEHLFEPVKMLNSLKEKLTPGGKIFIQTGDLKVNPFDLAVVDHCSHFTLETLEQLMKVSGFNVVASSDSWNAKEIGVLAEVSDDVVHECECLVNSEENRLLLERSYSWLKSVLETVVHYSGAQKIGIFGTAIAGIWLANSASEKAAFFVDEDITRTGKKLVGLEILSVSAIPDRATVYLPFPEKVAKSIYDRLKLERPDLIFLYPES